MKEYEFQKLTLTESEKAWLRAIRDDKESSERELRLKLLGKLSDEFNPDNLPRCLIYEHRMISLIAYWHLDETDPVFDEVDAVVKAIWDCLQKNPSIEQITAENISQSTEMPVGVVQNAMGHINHLRNFSHGGRRSADGFGYESLSISDGFQGISCYNNYVHIFDEMESLYAMYVQSANAQSNPFPTLTLREYYGSGLQQPETDGRVTIEPNTAFIIMPINSDNPELEEVNTVIKEVCMLFDIKAVRADDIEHSKRITDVILKKIRTSQHIIADLSHERPNVYYEIGYAHAVGKYPVLYCKEGTNLHFDLKDYNVPSYKGVLDLRDKLIKRFQEITGKTLEKK